MKTPTCFSRSVLALAAAPLLILACGCQCNPPPPPPAPTPAPDFKAMSTGPHQHGANSTHSVNSTGPHQ